MIDFLAYRAHETLEKQSLFNCHGGPGDIAHIIRCCYYKEIEKEMKAFGMEFKGFGESRFALEWKVKDSELDSRDSESKTDDEDPEEPIRNRNLTTWNSIEPEEVMNLTDKNYGDQLRRPP